MIYLSVNSTNVLVRSQAEEAAEEGGADGSSQEGEGAQGTSVEDGGGNEAGRERDEGTNTEQEEDNVGYRRQLLWGQHSSRSRVQRGEKGRGEGSGGGASRKGVERGGDRMSADGGSDVISEESRGRSGGVRQLLASGLHLSSLGLGSMEAPKKDYSEQVCASVFLECWSCVSLFRVALTWSIWSDYSQHTLA